MDDFMAASKPRNTVSAQSQHPPILGFLIGPSSILAQASWSCMALLVLAICNHPFMSFTCNLPSSMQFTKFFLICLYNMFQPTFSIIFPPLLPPLPISDLSYQSFLSCFIYKICSLVSFLITPLGYLISTKDLCRYFRNTEENCLSLISVWSWSQSHCDPQFITCLQPCPLCNPMQSSLILVLHCNPDTSPSTPLPYTN